MIRYIVTIGLLFTCVFSRAQVNYVLNPSFEEYSQCPWQYDQIGLAVSWSGIDSQYTYQFTPEYCNICAGSSGTVGIPWGGGPISTYR